jgi:tripartite-type tricarboxylate transporter receptor subunit TctC
MKLRRSFVLATLALAAAPAALAQTVIDKPLKIVVGFPPGGSTDTLARLLADQLRGSYAPQVIVENKPGAGGRIGVQTVKTGDADGSQMLVTPTSILTIYPHVYKKLGYDSLADFTPVSSAASTMFSFAVSSSVPANVKTVSEFMTWAKANPKDANYGSPAAGAMPHFVGVMLARAAGVPMNHVPFKGGAPLVSDLLGGQIQSGVNPLAETVQHHPAGKLRILAVSGAQRSKSLADVPTMTESGYKDVVAEEYFGVFVPSKTPAAAVAKLNAAVRNALKAQQVIDGLGKLAWDIKGESPEEFARIVGTELKRWGPVVQASGFSADE